MNKLGIDIGYSTFKYVYLDNNDNLLESGYIFHRGNIIKHYNELIEKIKTYSGDEIALGITGSLSSKLKISKDYYINNSISLIEGALFRNKNVKSIIEIGAQETKYITNIDNREKNNIKFFMNSSCAAGTGSFLEEQASRLSIDISDISEHIEKATTVPRIAGRCSVFSKTDMIHHQQEGVKIEDILLGLCYALVRNYKANVLQKNKINTPVMLTGGVINNKGVIKALKDVLDLKDDDLIIDEKRELITCFGACKVALEKNLTININKLTSLESLEIKEGKKSLFKQLAEFGDGDNLNKHNCKGEGSKEGYLGIDVGSTSINFVVIDDENKVIDYIYTKTNGKPKDMVLEYFDILKKRLGEDFKFKGIGTTGSGREYIGKLVNANLVVNEITAQAKGAVNAFDDVDTIFEIGGQDSKYISIENGLVKDFEMNKICAAGTGSFIEEQIKKLGVDINDFSDIALKGDNPSNLGDRCTVFIEGNIGKAIGEGDNIENISAGLSYSIVKNYLNRVVGNRKIGDKIFLQGGIAYNQAVINAFKSILNKEIIVPEFFSVTGALGVAILTKENLLTKSIIKQEGARETYLEKGQKYYLEGYDETLDNKKKTIGIPRVLFLNKMFPLFNEMFKRLGYNIILSDATNEEIITLSQEYAFEETCFPVKIINGHVAWLLKKEVDYILLPELHTMKHEGSKVREDYACVYMQTSPKIIDSVFNLKGKGVELLSPALSFNFGKEYMVKALLSLGMKLGKNKVETIAALMAGMKKLKGYEKRLENLGSEVLKEVSEDEKVFVILSRVYNIVDPTLNMGIEKRLTELGYKVLHLNHLEASEIQLKDEYSNMYWPFGQHMITGAKVIKQYKNLYPIYITNHGCGPDTILTHYVKKELTNRPYLHIEVDEHSSKVGVITRVEAFINSLNNTQSTVEEEKIEENIVSNNVLIPYMYPYSDILKVFLEKQGKIVTILDPVNENTIEIGKEFSITKEYFSLIGLMAEVLNKVKNDNNVYTLYLPTNEGSEAFGQYGKLIRDKALEIGKDLRLEAPFVEDILGDENFSVEFFKGILIGDLINQLDNSLKNIYVNDLLSCIKHSSITSDYLDNTLNKINKEFEKESNKKKLLVIGEPLVVYKDYLNNGVLENLSIDNKIIKQPLSEVLYITWKDFSNKRNKKNKTYIKLLDEVEETITKVNSVFKDKSIFNEDIQSINEQLKEILPMYAGEIGRYRLGKLFTAKNVDGIISASSMYENTSTILKIIREKHKDKIKVPVLDLYFDSNINKNNEELIETFITYL